jgi:thymidylate synthase
MSNIIIARDLNNAWRDTLWRCAANGYDYKIKKGSYEGQIRRQLNSLVIVIEEPWTRPFNFYTPAGIPSPTDSDKINKYFYDYLATDTKGKLEDYTYGEFIAPQIPKVVNLLNVSEGATNQACMNIGGEKNIDLLDPPCLRMVDFKVVNKTLEMSVFFRSWDLFIGLPENLGGLQLLKEYVLAQLLFEVDDGQIIAYSSGGHIYEQYFPIVNQMNIHQIEIKEESNE